MTFCKEVPKSEGSSDQKLIGKLLDEKAEEALADQHIIDGPWKEFLSSDVDFQSISFMYCLSTFENWLDLDLYNSFCEDELDDQEFKIAKIASDFWENSSKH